MKNIKCYVKKEKTGYRWALKNKNKDNKRLDDYESQESFNARNCVFARYVNDYLEQYDNIEAILDEIGIIEKSSQRRIIKMVARIDCQEGSKKDIMELNKIMKNCNTQITVIK